MRLTLNQRLFKLRAAYAKARKQKKSSEEIHRECVDVLRRILRRENAQDRRTLH